MAVVRFPRHFARPHEAHAVRRHRSRAASSRRWPLLQGCGLPTATNRRGGEKHRRRSDPRWPDWDPLHAHRIWLPPRGGRQAAGSSSALGWLGLFFLLSFYNSMKHPPYTRPFGMLEFDRNLRERLERWKFFMFMYTFSEILIFLEFLRLKQVFNKISLFL